ncbi:hypothetical protein B0T14DRAFT_250916 [Immersiella caudata]|uniref:NACHT domain-containing protein n=1 Tax=Immersiella caudata TaxID=314043 RepID=A0AA39WJR0_9PEZI|nr:hypothetical protein B0T14DRAFT_250916 [Immersiella caudata]
MEPTGAIGVAAAAIQFLDFGSRLLSSSCDIYRSPSGQTAKQVALSAIIDDLSSLLNQVEQTISIRLRSGSHPSPAEDQVLRLCKECKSLVAPVSQSLSRLQDDQATGSCFGSQDASGKTDRTVLAALRLALKAVWNEAEIIETFNKLDAMKRRITAAALFALWDDTKRIGHRQEQRQMQFSHRLDEMAEMLRSPSSKYPATPQGAAESPDRLTRTGEQVGGSSGDLIATLNDTSSGETQRVRSELITYLWDPQRRPKQPEWSSPNSEDPDMASTQSAFQHFIAQSMAFGEIQLREQTMPKAFEKTYEWIFESKVSTDTHDAQRPSFPEWLESDTKELYWITGKPGSGKSTLMNYVLQNQSLRRHLSKWSGSLPLLVTCYYAWLSGADLQKSSEGLMMTVLHQSLREYPSLVPAVAPRRWALCTTLRTAAAMPRWDRWEIEESFEALLSQCDDRFRLAIFVDGLDEFEVAPAAVIELIQRINFRSGTKLCIASRPWTEFNDAFRANPTLRMQDVNTADIKHVVKAKLEENQGFVDLRRIFAAETSRLIDEVVRKSSGVFLWVSIVVKSLLASLTEGDGLSELQATIDELPGDIAQLYDAIWASIKAQNVSKSAELLAIFKASQPPLDYLTLWLATEELPLGFDIDSLTLEGRSGIEDLVRRRLDSRTRGILEVTRGAVDFLHRTARDWASTPEVSARISSSVHGPFDPYILLLKAEAIRGGDKAYREGSIYRGVSQQQYEDRCLWYAYNVPDTTEYGERLTPILNLLKERFRSGWGIDALAEPGALSNTFLGLVAAFCVIPYLRESLDLDPRAVKHVSGSKCRSLLDNAVFGSQRYARVMSPGFAMSDNDISVARRLETVDFLLGRGANPRQKLVGRNVTILEMVRGRVSETKDVAEAEYWIKVEKLLSQPWDIKIRGFLSFRSRKMP